MSQPWGNTYDDVVEQSQELQWEDDRREAVKAYANLEQAIMDLDNHVAANEVRKEIRLAMKILSEKFNIEET